MTTSYAHTERLLRGLPLLNTLSDEEWQRLNDLAEHQTVRRQEFIYRRGQPTDTLYFLLEGTVKIGTITDDGREVIKHLLHPVVLFGEGGLFGESTRDEFAMAQQSEVHLLRLPTSGFRHLVRGNHQLSMQLLQWIAERLRHTENRLEALISKDARQRIIDFLVEAANRRGKRVGFETLIRHTLTQQEIANITGTSRQTVTSVLNDLRKSNLIHFNRRSILIRDLNKLC